MVRRIKLEYGERVIAVVPEDASGPGWSNHPISVYIACLDGRLRTEWIQPGERTAELHTLFSPGRAMCSALIEAVPTYAEGEEE